VTRLGECSHFGWLFTLGSFWKLQKWDTFWGYILPRLRLCINYGEKMGWSTFWRLFLQNHLVTLPPGKVSSRLSYRLDEWPFLYTGYHHDKWNCSY
jgi:hypothetical protein